jgi:hypothetical protein
MGDIEQKIAQPVIRTLAKVSEKIPRAMAQRFHELGQTARKAADEFDKTEEHIASRVPVYKVEADGSVHKLVGGEFKPLSEVASKEDELSGIKTLLGPDGKASTWESGKFKLGDEENESVPGDLGPKPPNERNPIKSQKVEPGSTDLSMATARARLADNEASYGRNYVAFHYQDQTKGHNFVLVGRSEPNQAHSEQYAGIPFLEKGIGEHVKGVYTERSPCDSGRNCEAWLSRYFNKGKPSISHSFDYDKPSRVQGHGQMAGYLQGLFGLDQ